MPYFSLHNSIFDGIFGGIVIHVRITKSNSLRLISKKKRKILYCTHHAMNVTILQWITIMKIKVVHQCLLLLLF